MAFRKRTPKALEAKRKVQAQLSRSDEFERMNLYWADYFLRRRAEYGDDSIEVQYALRVMARLQPELEM